MAVFEKPDDLNKPWASTGEKRKPSDTKISQGFVKEVPKYQDFNYILGKQDEALAHINQFGIANWDAETEYQANRSVVQTSDGCWYIAKTTHSNSNPLLDVTKTNWRLYNDPNPVNPTMSTSFAISMSNPLKISVSGGQLIFSGQINRINNTTTSILTLPEKYRPTEQKLLTCVKLSAGNLSSFLIEINTNGNVLTGVVGSSTVVGDFLIITGSIPL